MILNSATCVLWICTVVLSGTESLHKIVGPAKHNPPPHTPK